MRRTCYVLIISLFMFASSISAALAADGKFLTLCYHNVVDDQAQQGSENVTTGKLIEQLSWLQHEGYQAISIDDLLAARDGRRPLPEKAVLLTFDDGYESFYTRVYPILLAFHFPAVIGLVDSWMANGIGANGQPGESVQYGEEKMPREAFLTWAQVREMVGSGLVEVASHSHALHEGIIANPQGNKEPAEVTSGYDASTNSYEIPVAYKQRLLADAATSAQVITKETGRAPRSMIWPYGAYNQLGIMIQNNYGMPITLSLDDGFGSIDKLMAVPRYLVNGDPDLGDYVSDMRKLGKPRPMRVIQVDLDYVYDPDPAQMARNVDKLVERVYEMKISAVFLQAFADPEGSGLARALYFPNRYLPMRADLFNRVAWQLRNRAHVKVFGWLPVLSFDFGRNINQIETWNPNTNQTEMDPNPKAYHRASPFDPAARNGIIGIYEDLARLAPIDGLLFHDDAVMSDFEDASPYALGAYQAAGFPPSIQVIRSDPALMAKWTKFKTDALISFTEELANHARIFRSPLLTVRDIYAPVVLEGRDQEWFAQNYDAFLAAYDYTAIMAMPEMENVPEDEAESWMQQLVVAASRRPNGLTKTIFELQSVDWRKTAVDEDRSLPTERLGAQMRYLASQGALNFGYYPDDFVTNTPDAGLLHKDFSLQTYPYVP